MGVDTGGLNEGTPRNSIGEYSSVLRAFLECQQISRISTAASQSSFVVAVCTVGIRGLGNLAQKGLEHTKSPQEPDGRRPWLVQLCIVSKMVRTDLSRRVCPSTHRRTHLQTSCPEGPRTQIVRF